MRLADLFNRLRRPTNKPPVDGLKPTSYLVELQNLSTAIGCAGARRREAGTQLSREAIDLEIASLQLKVRELIRQAKEERGAVVLDPVTVEQGYKRLMTFVWSRKDGAAGAQ